ncbi:recombinase family protein [Spirosoma sordidisoli]|uniref:Recombinase family protein n=1 Tax=Spirosoma sordidisoli TaxID=2502893 RepID=A0A4Q2ULB9_9BACT|nr:recombinase family protein [Spirosoma sordidisoli]RYC70016.1 recombinase family protein [Spirosoma sordidisoli]
MLIGYARANSEDQTLSLQVDALKTAGCEKIFREKVSVARAERPELNKMLGQIRAGDTVVIWKLDRLGHSMKHLVGLVTEFKNRAVEFRSLKESIDTSSAVGNCIFHLFSSLAELERDLIRERTNAGLSAARQRGRVGGRRRGITPDLMKKGPTAKLLYESKTVGVDELSRQLGISKPTLYKLLKHEGVQISPYTKQST